MSVLSHGGLWVYMSLTASYATGTGEHGVGLGKKEYLREELGVNTVELMKNIKKAVDPLNIMNPGKVSTRFYLVAPR